MGDWQKTLDKILGKVAESSEWNPFHRFVGLKREGVEDKLNIHIYSFLGEE